MFISYKYKEYLDRKDGKYICGYELTDSEFGTISGVTEIYWTFYAVIIGTAVIQEYSKRNLNVAANLALALVWYDKKNAYLSIQQMIDLNKKYNTLFPQYEEDLQKYLVLL
jgi:hypothetical protein